MYTLYCITVIWKKLLRIFITLHSKLFDKFNRLQAVEIVVDFVLVSLGSAQVDSL